VNGKEAFVVSGLRYAVRKVVELNIRKIKSQAERGFSLLELMIAMFILVILLSVALPTYQRSVQHAKETVLKENLWQMRKAIDQYASDKGKYPQSLNDLVEGKYLREMPVDPMLEKAEWKEIMGEDPMDPDAGEVLKDVKSTAEGVDSNGQAYDSESY
jgi:general secretion pathway protein G